MLDGLHLPGKELVSMSSSTCVIFLRTEGMPCENDCGRTRLPLLLQLIHPSLGSLTWPCENDCGRTRLPGQEGSPSPSLGGGQSMLRLA
jgi:hypothetical protein